MVATPKACRSDELFLSKESWKGQLGTEQNGTVWLFLFHWSPRLWPFPIHLTHRKAKHTRPLSI
jgi:hypothetical protein